MLSPPGLLTDAANLHGGTLHRRESRVELFRDSRRRPCEDPETPLAGDLPNFYAMSYARNWLLILKAYSRRLRRGAPSWQRVSSSSLSWRVTPGHAGGPADAERIRSWICRAGRGGFVGLGHEHPTLPSGLPSQHELRSLRWPVVSGQEGEMSVEHMRLRRPTERGAMPGTRGSLAVVIGVQRPSLAWRTLRSAASLLLRPGLSSRAVPGLSDRKGVKLSDIARRVSGVMRFGMQSGTAMVPWREPSNQEMAQGPMAELPQDWQTRASQMRIELAASVFIFPSSASDARARRRASGCGSHQELDMSCRTWRFRRLQVLEQRGRPHRGASAEVETRGESRRGDPGAALQGGVEGAAG